MVRIAALLIGYVFGLFQTAFFYGKANGIDIRDKGSGNAGTTNALRTLGAKAGAIVMIGDIAKCMIAIALVRLILVRMHPDMDYLLRAYCGAGCILGHNYPFYMGFRGGKGVACTAGYVFSFSLVMSIVGLIIFFGNLFITHLVSLGSLLVGVMIMTGTLIMGQMGRFGLTKPLLIELYVVTALIVIEMFWKHRENIKKLLNGTERRTYITHKK